jgi:hypothetical protein
MRDSIGIIRRTMRKHAARNKTCARIAIYIARPQDQLGRPAHGVVTFRRSRIANPVANTLIHESRRLQFPLDTLVDALIELEDKQGHWPPRTTVVGATIANSEGNDAGVILSVHRPEGGAVVERRYSLSMIAAAIVNYCLTLRVPIPRKSTKSIQLLPDGVALVLENTLMLQSRHEELSTLAAGSVKPLSPAPLQKPQAVEEPATDGAASQDAAASFDGASHPDGAPKPVEGPPDGPGEAPAGGQSEGPGASETK